MFEYLKSIGTTKATEEQIAKLKQLMDAADASKNYLSEEEGKKMKESLLALGILKITTTPTNDH